MWQYSQSNEFYHHGILGMKWGAHRARVNMSKSATAKGSAKEWDEYSKIAKNKGQTKKAAKYKKFAVADRVSATKYQAKSKKIIAKHERLAGGKKVLTRVEKQSMGKTVAQSLLMGSYGASIYNLHRANGQSRGKSAVMGVLSNAGNVMTYGVGGIAEPRIRARIVDKKNNSK